MRIVIESKRAGLVKALIYAIATVVVYILVFTNQEKFLEVLSRKDYLASIFSMGFTVFVAALYGTAVSKFLKHTLEKALESQCMREE